MEYKIKTVADLESACQLAANAGLAVHAIEVSTDVTIAQVILF